MMAKRATKGCDFWVDSPANAKKGWRGRRKTEKFASLAAASRHARAEAKRTKAETYVNVLSDTCGRRQWVCTKAACRQDRFRRR